MGPSETMCFPQQPKPMSKCETSLMLKAVGIGKEGGGQRKLLESDPGMILRLFDFLCFFFWLAVAPCSCCLSLAQTHNPLESQGHLLARQVSFKIIVLVCV